MKYFWIAGGLGNQINMYVIYRYYQKRHPDQEVYLDDSWFFLKKKHQGYELRRSFNLKPNLLSSYFSKMQWDHMIETYKEEHKNIPQQLLESGISNDLVIIREGEGFPPQDRLAVVGIDPNTPNTHLFDLRSDVYYQGYWGNSLYFRAYKEELLEELTFIPITDNGNNYYKDMIMNSLNSTAVHIRRGDFVELGWYCGDTYYKNAIETICKSKDITLFVFSNDINYCKKNIDSLGLNIPSKTIFVDENCNKESSFRDCQLMSMCKNIIVAPCSTFSAWAARLNKNPQLIITPDMFKGV